MHNANGQVGIDIVAHRLFGPQPHTATYLCIWDIHVGRVMVHLTAIEARVLAAAGQAFALNFSDPLNAPAAEHDIPLDPDGESAAPVQYSGVRSHLLLQ